jgi:hypothetical protein
MKFFFSFILVLNSTLATTPFIQISYKKEHLNYVLKIRDILDKNFKVPKVMYKLKEIKEECDELDHVKAIHFCVNESNFKIIYRDQRVLSETLGVFWQ